MNARISTNYEKPVGNGKQLCSKKMKTLMLQALEAFYEKA
jgi:hypothetical protein